MNSRTRKLDKDMIIAVLMLLMGAAALLIGNVFNIERDSMNGMAIGLIPTALLFLVVFTRLHNKPQYQKNKDIENDERLVFIRGKAGGTAFWITLWLIFIGTMFSNVLGITVYQFGLGLMVFMSILYFVLIGIYAKKY